MSSDVELTSCHVYRQLMMMTDLLVQSSPSVDDSTDQLLSSHEMTGDAGGEETVVAYIAEVFGWSTTVAVVVVVEHVAVVGAVVWLDVHEDDDVYYGFASFAFDFVVDWASECCSTVASHWAAVLLQNFAQHPFPVPFAAVQ
jgi:hypothetical protein